jgi:5-methylthioadenosine/S-adenosylhomocysteine deaminase
MMIEADLLLTNAVVLTMDIKYSLFDPGAVAIKDNKIVAVGMEQDLRDRVQTKASIDCEGKVLMPGLVNAHTHVPMTLLRGLADDLRLDVWLLGYMMPVEREFVSPDFVRLGTQIAAAELIRTGVTCFADMYYFEEEIAKATAAVGMRAVCSQTVLKFPTPDAGSFEESLALAREFIQNWQNHPLIIPSVAPHAPYTCTEEILRSSAELAAEFDVPLHTHLAETVFETDQMMAKEGMRVIPYVERHNLFDAKVIAAHCVHIDENEMHLLRHYKAGIAHNPSSNLKLASGAAPISSMIELGLNVGIGTDGPASNNDLDMFEEVRLASLLAKGISGDPTTIPAKTALSMATRLGANALHLGHITGSLEIGKKADLILVDVNPLHNSPSFKRDPSGRYAQIVYAGKSTDVTDVMVDGKWLMRNRSLLTLDEETLLAEAKEYARRIDIFLIHREESLLSKLVAIEGTTEGESFEIQAKVRVDEPEAIHQQLSDPSIEILYHRHYHEYDTYFHFSDPKQGKLRYREDEYIDPDGKVTNVRYRLTLVGPSREDRFPSEVLLSRSRYIAPATHSLRFYREYFKPDSETFIEKHRLRWRILFKGIEFYVNLDKVEQPELGYFLEVKSRTWSRRDAENKSILVGEILHTLGLASAQMVSQDYIEIISTT